MSSAAAEFEGTKESLECGLETLREVGVSAETLRIVTRRMAALNRMVAKLIEIEVGP